MGKKKESKHSNVRHGKLAEKQLKSRIGKLSKLPPLEVKNLLHEFQAYQIKLETQNEELRSTQQKLDDAREKYFDLFNFAPIGYLTLSEDGLIVEANLTAANLFGLPIVRLKKKPISDLIIKEDEDRYYFNHKEMLRTGNKQQFELRMKGNEGTIFWAYVTSIIDKNLDKTSNIRLTISDISERIQIDEQIRFQATLLNAVGQAVIATGIEGNIVYMNHAAENMYGWVLNKVIGRNIMNVTVPQISQKQATYIMKKLKKGESWVGEFYVQRNDGTVFPVLINDSPIFDKNGNLIGIIGVSFDITEQKKAEHELKESERKYHELFNNVQMGMFRSKVDGSEILDLNDHYWKIFGRTHEEMLGTPSIMYWVDPREREEMLSILKRDGIVNDFECRIFSKDGKIINCLTSVRLNSEEGIMEGSIIDITARKQAEELLKANELKFRTVADFTYDWEYWEDENDQIIYISPSCERITGYTREEFTSDPALLKKIVHPDDIGLIINTCKKFNLYHQESDVEEFEFRIIKKDGSIGIIHHICKPIFDENNKFRGMRVSNREITERKRIQEALRKLTQHLQSIREEERSNIAREIHDDLGQTLTALKMDIKWIKKEVDLSNKPVQNKIDIMSDMIDSTIQRIQRLASELRPGILDDLGLPAAIEWLTEEIKKRTEIIFELTISPEDISLKEDLSINIFRIVQETLTNIIRHSKATNVKIKIEIVNNELNINIKDNGVGIAKEKINDINSLGLTGIRERARYWNGTVDIKGKKNSGTEVLVKLQLNDEDFK